MDLTLQARSQDDILSTSAFCTVTFDALNMAFCIRTYPFLNASLHEVTV